MSILCAIEGCRNKALARNWCSRHWQRWQRHGSPTAGGIDRPNVTVAERFWSKVNKTSECWIWTGVTNDGGYGLFSHQGKNERAHRFAWSLSVGEIPGGLQIDHKCRNRMCVNPSHLRPATNKQNSEHVQGSSSSGYRGVSFNARRGKWVVQVTHDGRNHYGGYFTDVHEAGAAAKSLRNELFTHNDLDRSRA